MNAPHGIAKLIKNPKQHEQLTIKELPGIGNLPHCTSCRSCQKDIDRHKPVVVAAFGELAKKHPHVIPWACADHEGSGGMGAAEAEAAAPENCDDDDHEDTDEEAEEGIGVDSEMNQLLQNAQACIVQLNSGLDLDLQEHV